MSRFRRAKKAPGGLFPAGAGGRAEPRSVAPAEARKRWRAACDAALGAVSVTTGARIGETFDPDMARSRMDALRAALKAVEGVAFPLEAGDLRRAFADAARGAIVAFALAERPETRAEAAGLVAAGARWMEGVLIEQGAALARAGVARIDPGEREG